jgi:hypothetical protein
MLIRWLCSPLVLFLATPLFSQPSPAPVVIHFHVMQGNHPVRNLTEDDFIVLEDGAPLNITNFWDGETARRNSPIELIFLLDSTIPLNRLTPIPTDNPLSNTNALAAMLHDPRQEFRAAIYGFGSSLKQFCPPTRDLGVLNGAMLGARGVPYLQRHELPASAFDGLGAPPQQPDIGDAAIPRYTPPIPAPGKRMPGPRHKGENLSWNEALIALAQDISAQSSNATRIVIPLLYGLPQPSWDPQQVARVYQELGLGLYPRLMLRPWILSEKWALTHHQPERHGAPIAPGVDWKKMTTQDKLAWVDNEDSLAKNYEALAPQTGANDLSLGSAYRMMATLLTVELPSMYTAQVIPPASGKLEIRLKDNTLGQIVGGVRHTPPPD